MNLIKQKVMNLTDNAITGVQQFLWEIDNNQEMKYPEDISDDMKYIFSEISKIDKKSESIKFQLLDNKNMTKFMNLNTHSFQALNNFLTHVLVKNIKQNGIEKKKKKQNKKYIIFKNKKYIACTAMFETLPN